MGLLLSKFILKINLKKNEINFRKTNFKNWFKKYEINFRKNNFKKNTVIWGKTTKKKYSDWKANKKNHLVVTGKKISFFPKK